MEADRLNRPRSNELGDLRLRNPDVAAHPHKANPAFGDKAPGEARGRSKDGRGVSDGQKTFHGATPLVMRLTSNRRPFTALYMRGMGALLTDPWVILGLGGLAGGLRG